MKIGMKIVGVSLAAVAMVSMGACKKKTAGEKLDDAIDDAGKAVEEASKELEKATEKK